MVNEHNAIDDLEEIADKYKLSDEEWESVDDASDYLFEHKVKKGWFEILKSINYSAVVLDEESKRELLGLDIPKGWKPIAHHMTITLGPLKEDSKYNVGEEIIMPIIAIGKDDRAMAVKVKADGANIKSFPHITVAINPDGGKPFHSNKIPEENFEKFSGTLRGIVTEIPN